MKVEMFRTSYVHISELSQEEMKDLSTAMDLLIRHKVIQQSTLSVTDASPEKTREDRREHSKWNTLSIQELRTVADDALRSLAEAREEIAGRKDQISDLHELLESAESERDQLRQRIEKAAELLKPCPNEDCPICKGPKRTAALAILIPLDAK